MSEPRTPASLRAELRRHALGLPGASVDHPWGEDVVKVGKKIFLFLGVDDGSDPPTGILFDWVEESYRNVAPRRLVTQLDGAPRPRASGEAFVLPFLLRG